MVTKEITMYIEPYDNENSTYQHLWNAGNSVPRVKFIVLIFILGDKKI